MNELTTLLMQLNLATSKLTRAKDLLEETQLLGFDEKVLQYGTKGIDLITAAVSEYAYQQTMLEMRIKSIFQSLTKKEA